MEEFELCVFIPTVNGKRVAAVISPIEGKEISEARLKEIRLATYVEDAYSILMKDLPSDQWVSVLFRVNQDKDGLNIKIESYCLFEGPL